jgi:seryl-tRNA synthetase
MGILDKVKQVAGEAAEATKKGAAIAQTKAKIFSLRKEANEAAEKLGYLVHRERTGGEPAGAEADELVQRISELQAQIAELEAGLEAEGEAAAEGPAPGTEGEAGGSAEGA